MVLRRSTTLLPATYDVLRARFRGRVGGTASGAGGPPPRPLGCKPPLDVVEDGAAAGGVASSAAAPA
eukprot:15457753-Alexandrium_andersonii.AAC.1